MRIATNKNIGFIEIQDISNFSQYYKYQVVFFSNKSVEPISKRFKTKLAALSYAKKLKKKYF
jgi:hypothetical protein